MVYTDVSLSWRGNCDDSTAWKIDLRIRNLLSKTWIIQILDPLHEGLYIYIYMYLYQIAPNMLIEIGGRRGQLQTLIQRFSVVWTPRKNRTRTPMISLVQPNAPSTCVNSYMDDLHMHGRRASIRASVH